MAASVLIIGQAGRLRDSLRTILVSFNALGEIRVAEGFEKAYLLAEQSIPAVVIVDGGDYLEQDCLPLKELLARSSGCQCIVIVNTLQQSWQARAAGANAVLLQGFSTNELYETLVSLEIVPRSGDGQKSINARKEDLWASSTH